MKTLKMLLAACFALSSLGASAAWDLYKSGLSVNGGYYDCQLDGLSPNFQHYYFGRYSSGGTIEVNFAEVLTFKNGASNVCSATLRYRVYRTCDTAPSFSSLSLPFCCNFGASDCNGGACGPDVNNAGDQKWRGVPGATLNLLSGLTASGTYIIEVYFEATGDDAGGCSNTKYSNNGGANFRAYFEYEVNDHFGDANFTSPTWSGDAANYTVANNSTTSGLTGSEANRTSTVKLNVASGSGTQYISTQIASWDAQQEWYFWVGRDGVGGAPSDLDANNQQAIYLYANESNLESATVDGYRILLGQTGTSYIRLQRIDNGTATTVFTSSNGIPSALTDYGIAFKVVRTQLGVWTIYTSTLPTNSSNTQSTPTPNSCVASLATVNQGGTTDNTYTPATNGYFGFMAIHDNTAEGRVAAEFDSFRFRALAPDTYLVFNGAATGQVDESAPLASNFAIGVDIVNPSSTSATSIDIVLYGDATRAGGGPNPTTAYAPSYTTQTLTWAAGQTATKYIYIDPANNALCDDIAELLFRLENPSGGTNAFVGTADTLQLTVIDDDSGYENLVDQDFNSGSISGWKTTGTAWTANATSPIEGAYSARHSSQAVSGQSSLAYPIDDANLSGITTAWRFEVAFANDASANNNFQIFLAANDSNLYSSSVDGYAVVIDQSSLPSAGTADYIRLYRVTDGAYASTPIINSTTDWVDNVNGGTRVGIQVILDEDGTWSLSVDANGGFNNLTSLGTGTDVAGGAITFPIVKYFGVRFKYLAAASDLFRFDDVLVAQSGCKRLWYSRATGNSNGAIWSPTTTGAAQTVVAGRYDRFVIQSGNTVTATGTWLLNDITISSGATLLGGSSEMRVHGNWINEGTFTAGTSTVVFKGQAAQTIGFAGAASPTTFNNLTIDNDGNSVTLSPSAVSATGLVSLQEGTLQTSPGGLTLISTSTGSASIGEIKAGASISGDVILQRYIPSIPSNQGYWFNLGCPIQGQTIAMWNDDILTTGFPGSDYPSYGFNNIQYYNETVSGTMNTGYTGATNVTNSIEINRGYYVWLAGAAQNLDNTGTIQTGQVSIPLSYTVTSPGGIFDYGWNLIANPYPSEIDWNLCSASLSGPKVYYVFDYQSNTYKFRNATTNTGTASRYIAHSQGFMVKVNATGQNLVCQETHKTNTGAAFERSGDSDNSFVALRFAKGMNADESMLVFDSAANAGYDDFDVADLQSPVESAVEMTLMAEGAPLAQDARPFDGAIEIPVMLEMPEAGTYTFSVIETQQLPLGACLMVYDMITGESMQLTTGATMTITTNEPFFGERLVIRSTPAVTAVVTPATCHGATDGTVDVSLPSGNWSVSLSATEGFEYLASASTTFDHLTAGQYLLQVTNDICGTSSMLVNVEEPMEVNTLISGSHAVECNQGTDGMISFEVENANWFTYDLRNSAGEVVRSGEVEGAQAMVEGLNADVYELSVYTTCSNEVLHVDLRDEDANAIGTIIPVVSMLSDETALVTLNAETAQPASINWTLSNGMQVAGNSVQFETTTDASIVYQVTCDGVCPVTASGVVNVAALVLSNQEMENNAPFGFAQTANEIQLTASGVETSMVNARVFDAQGRLIHSRTFVASSGHLETFDTSTWSKGVYTLSIENQGAPLFSRAFSK
ncbi:MAG: hypothetical protein ACK478_02650 [Flavobacteriales bacterium]|jgi:hypothetical protein